MANPRGWRDDPVWRHDRARRAGLGSGRKRHKQAVKRAARHIAAVVPRQRVQHLTTRERAMFLALLVRAYRLGYVRGVNTSGTARRRQAKIHLPGTFRGPS